MDFPRQQFSDVRTKATVSRMGDPPPPFVMLLCALLQGETAQHGVTAADTVDGATEWRAFWLTPTRALYAQASRHGSWSPNADKDADSSSGWSVPLSALTELELVEAHSGMWEGTWSIGGRWAVKFGDRRVSLPLFSEGRSDDLDDTDDLIAALAGGSPE